MNVKLQTLELDIIPYDDNDNDDDDDEVIARGRGRYVKKRNEKLLLGSYHQCVYTFYDPSTLH